MTAQNINLEELLKELDPETLQALEQFKKLLQTIKRPQALRFREHLIKYLKENNFHAGFIKFFNENIQKTDSFLGGEQMFIDLSEEKLNCYCDLLVKEFLILKV